MFSDFRIVTPAAMPAVPDNNVAHGDTIFQKSYFLTQFMTELPDLKKFRIKNYRRGIFDGRP
jgi:hypothetical protein